MKGLKRILCALLAALCVLSFTACEDNGKTADTDDKESKNSKMDKASYYFEYGGTKVALGADADDIIEALGEYKDKKEIGDCGGLGAQVKYSYASFDVYVLESKTDGNIIDQITFRDDIVETPEGVCIGMSMSDAKAKLGEPTGSTDSSLEYLDGNKLLKLSIADGKISGIDYMTVSE